ncbi:SDR family oxidoreductase [Edaphovirga cremea]|uniref:SDR family oxidoreductase n=1 Tax=Edaphovirga cremea TaxID=2267246 RepID=UPI000DEEF573|nr:SDR family oxidoreductase [Edaphovirga cremea]
MSTDFDNGAPKAQKQDQQPGLESEMDPQPIYFNPEYKAAGKLEGKVAVITGGDSGIGRAVAITYAQEGAKVVIVYLNEDSDAQKTKEEIEKFTKDVLLISGNISEPGFCEQVIHDAVNKFGSLDILVNNAAEQHPQKRFEDISNAQLHQTFATNIFSMFYLIRAALPHMSAGSSIINTTSITAYKGNPLLIDYSSTKGAITSLTRSLALHLAERKIRVNGVAPGPIWTPLIPSTFSKEHVGEFGEEQPLGRPGQPAELAPAYVYLACDDSSYVTGQVIHINGGTVVNG